MSDCPLLLAIETSCDETAASVSAGRRLLSSVVASQVEIHARYGGIVPEVASRQHLLAILPAIDRAMAQAGAGPADIQAVAVTHGPGLAGSLLVGVNAAKGLALAWNVPLIGINHLEAHIYANWAEEGSGARTPEFPLLCLIVSGGHTDLVLMESHLEYRLLGRTRDDAAGEAFDKGARLLGLGYPGGPAVQRAAESGDAHRVKLPRAWLRGSNDFSFSGLKTSLWHFVSGRRPAGIAEPQTPTVYDLAASFQEAVVEVLVDKTLSVARRHGVKSLLLAGGVASNGPLRRRFQDKAAVPLFIPPPSLCTDNAAMVAVCGYYYWQSGRFSGADLDVAPGLPLVGSPQQPAQK